MISCTAHRIFGADSSRHPGDADMWLTVPIVTPHDAEDARVDEQKARVEQMTQKPAPAVAEENV